MSSTTPVVKEHAADEAGGEVIYSSEGADPLPPIQKPPPAKETSWFGDDALEEDSLYPVTVAETASRVLSETPAQRLERVKEELESISREISQQDALQQQIVSLQERLVQQQQQLGLSKTQHTSAKDEPSAPSPALSELEQKLQRLEQLVGSSSTTTKTGNKAFLERLSVLEQSMDVMDDSKLEAASRKAKLIRQDLEAASKARSKLLAATSGTSSSRAAEDSKIITGLYDTMLELQDVQTHLPALVQRLKVLSIQHADAATWAGRLQSAEQAVTRLSTQLSSTETAVERIEQAWSTGHLETQLRENLQALDQRIADLSS